jgi:hypothetical protein
VRLTGLLRPAPRLSDVGQALLTELGAYRDGERHVPNAWAVHLSPRDARKRSGDLPTWSTALSDVLVEEHDRLGLPASGVVTVSFAPSVEVEPGEFRVSAGIVTGPATVVPRPSSLPGRPRLVLAAGGTARHGTPRAAGVDREVMLRAGSFVVGRDKEADLRLPDASVSPRHITLEVTEDRVRLRDLGSLNGTLVDGVPAVAVDLVDGNRIQIGETTLLFRREDTEDDGGREGGEGGEGE